MTSKNYCADLQGGLWLKYNSTNSNWYAKPCCMYKTSYVVKTDIDKEFWNHPDIVKRRQDNIAGNSLPTECDTCIRTEFSGNKSRRLAWNERLGVGQDLSNSVWELDIQADFTCNLACRICGPEFSTKWRQISATPNNTEVKKFKVRADNTALDILSTVPCHDLRQIHFQGGEPFLTTTHVDILKKLQDKVDLSQITLWYHSNGTVRVSDEVLKFWEQFKMVEIYFSLDDMGPRMEYQRWPMQWNEVHENMLWYRDNLPHNTLLRVERTIGILTAYWADEIETWHTEYFSKTKYSDDITLNYHGCFGQLSFGALSNEYIDAIVKKFPKDHWVYKEVQLHAGKENPVAIKFMLDYLDKHDAIRGQDWRKTYPEMLEWYQRYL